MINSSLQFLVLDGFEDSLINKNQWNDLVQRGSSNVIFITYQWQSIWWEVFGRGKLLLILALQDGKPIAIAPLFAHKGMIFFVGSGGSDYLDFIGDISDPKVLEGMLVLAKEQVPDFLGFRFYHVLENSKTHSIIFDLANKKDWVLYDEGELPSPILALKDFPEKAHEATRKKSLLRHEAWFSRNGRLKIDHLQKSEDILPHLKNFFEQHISRWNVTDFPSLFLEPQQQLFYKRITETLAKAGWLIFTRVIWQENSIAFHFGFNYHGCFLWYKPSFDLAYAKHSPGEVLLRQLLLNARKEEAQTFDFGLGDEAFKKRFATSTRFVKTLGIYPQNVIKKNYYEKSFGYKPSSR